MGIQKKYETTHQDAKRLDVQAPISREEEYRRPSSAGGKLTRGKSKQDHIGDIERTEQGSSLQRKSTPLKFG